jgi:hypothetical protein
MTEETLKKFTFDSENLKELLKAKEFLVEGLPLIKFEDKKPYMVEVMTDSEILSRNTEYGLKFYVKVKVKEKMYYWQMSRVTLKKIEEHIKDINKFNIMLDSANKTYSVVPLAE